MAIGWVFLASPGAGFINGALRAVFAPLGLNIQINVLSWPGVIFVYALYFVPYVYLIVAAAFRNIDPALEEASRLSGASMWMTLRRVSLPAIKPALIGASLLIVIVGLSLYSVPVVIANRAGIDILSVRILRSLNFEFPPRTDQAIVLSLFMLAAIAVVWMIQRRVTGSGNFATIGGKSARHVIVELGPWKWVARTFMFAYILFTSILPLAALLIVALQPFWRPVIDPSTFTLDNFYDALIGRPVTRAGLMHSLTLGIIVGIVGMLLATLMALYVKNAPRAIGRVVDGTMKFPAALSHIVIAVGFLLAFSGPPFYMSGTLVLLFIVYIILHLPEASIAATAAVSQVGKDLLEASETSGASQSRTFRKILLPLIVPGFVSGWALLFVLTAGELTASSLLAGIRNPVVGFVLLDIWEQGTFGTLAALAFTFTLITSTVVFVATLISRRGFHSR
jgi:iron(III) transport system permease protein